MTAMMQDRYGEDGPGEVVRLLVPLASKTGEDGHEGRRESGDDEHVEDELGQDEGGVVDVELAAGAERAGEGAVAHEAHDVARQREGREQDGASRQDRDEEVSEAGDHPAVSACQSMSAE